MTADVRTGMSLQDLADELGRRSVVIVALQAWPSLPDTDPAKGWEDGQDIGELAADEPMLKAVNCGQEKSSVEQP